jgi:fatty-acid desaturase
VLMYLLSGYGVTVGFHRMLTHRAFQTHQPRATCSRFWARCRCRVR